jgi:hypothetical protein
MISCSEKARLTNLSRTYAETDVLFENKVSARKFKSTYVDPFAHGNGTVGKMEAVDTKRSEDHFEAPKA